MQNKRQDFQISQLKIWRAACKMAVKFLSKQSPEPKPPQFYKVTLLNLLL